MGKCILEHCEFAWGGHCVLVCPKGLGGRIERENAAQRIDEFVKVLKGIRNRVAKKADGGLPAGVCIVDGRYTAYITYCKKQIWLGSFDGVQEAISIRREAEEAKRGGTFPQWYEKHKESRKKNKKPRGGAAKRDEGKE